MSGEVTAWVPGHLICNGEGQTAGGKPHRGLWRLATSFVRSTRLMAAAGGSPDFVDQSRRAAGYVDCILKGEPTMAGIYNLWSLAPTASKLFCCSFDCVNGSPSRVTGTSCRGAARFSKLQWLT
jgi:hypothetical protein